jgi:hypothetical protein
MRVALQDRLLSEQYMLPISRSVDMDPVPDPDSLASSAGMLAARSGRGVFRLLPPGATPIPVEGLVARFEGGLGPRLLAQLEAPGGPADSLWAEWVVLDSGYEEETRGTSLLSPSACSATTRRVGDFAASLTPGTHVVGMSVRGAHGARGVVRQEVELEAPRGGLALSDVVITCGSPGPEARSVVRLEPNPGARVSGAGPLTAYFEIYYLRPGIDGLARFEYVYTVTSVTKDDRFWLHKLFAPRPTHSLSVSRREEHLGELRRQFVAVPVGSLPPGRYRLGIKVRDLVAGAEVAREVEFSKSARPAHGSQ